ncbi:MAG: carboxypeptidase-like regulatory domain-containing protein [Rudaea sp.]
MIPWNKLPRGLQKYLLISVILSGSTSVSGACSPVVCDPAPPPPTTTLPPTITPTVTGTPLICDPMPPPTILTPLATPMQTPMIFDPAPPPASATPKAGATFIPPMICDPAPAPGESRGPVFSPRNLKITSDSSVPGVAVVEGHVVDAYGNPVGGVQVTATSGSYNVVAGTDKNGYYFIDVREPGAFVLHVGDDDFGAVPLQLKQNDRASLDWVMGGAYRFPTPLPLAEMRTVRINPSSHLEFRAETPWPGARLRWSVSGGALSEEGATVKWKPPAAGGRYLLQLVAEWGQAGVAVHSLVLIVDDDGTIAIRA